MEPERNEAILPDAHFIRIETSSREETVAIGSLLGRTLRAGDVICLDGDLGAGKTAFTDGIAKGMGVSGVIASPTFTILIEHTKMDSNGLRLPLYHFDAYRLSGEDDFYGLGFDEYLSGQGVCVIEWADRIRQAVPDQAVHVALHQRSVEMSDRRDIAITFPKREARTEWFEKEVNTGDWRTP